MLKNKISDLVKDVFVQTPFLEFYHGNGILNSSSLASKIKYFANKKKVMSGEKEISLSAIIMALKRFAPPFEHKRKDIGFYMSDINQISINPNLKYYRFEKSGNYKKLISEHFKFSEESFSKTYLMETNTGFTLIYEMKDDIDFVTNNDLKYLEFKEYLSAVSIYFDVEDVRFPGLYYVIFKQLAWFNINVFEISSSGREITLIIDNDDVKLFFEIVQANRINIFS